MGLGIGTIEASAELLGFGDHAIASNEIAIQVLSSGEGLVDEHLYLEAKGSNGPVIALVERALEQVTLEFKQFDPLSTHNIFRSLDIGGNPVTEGTLLAENVDASVNYVDSNDVQAGLGYQYKIISNNTNNLVRLAPGASWADVRAAVDSVDPVEGKVIIVPSGLYLVDQELVMDKDNTHIIFDQDSELRLSDHGSVMRNYVAATTYGTLGDAGNNCSFTGGYLTPGTEEGTTGSLMYFGLSLGYNWKFKNIRFGEVYENHAIEINGAQNIKIIDCQFDGLYSELGPYSNEIGREIIQIEPSDNGGGPAYTGDHVASTNILIEGCSFKNPIEHASIPTSAIGDYNGNNGRLTENVRVRHCHFEDIYCGVDPYEFIDTLVEYCTFHNVTKPVNTSSGTNNTIRYLKVTSD